MQRTFFISLVAVSMLLATIAPRAQSQAEQLKEYSRVLPGLDVTLTVVDVNDITAPILFQPPTLYAMRARAKEATLLYIQGKADKDIVIDTTNFKIEQAGSSATAAPTNIKNFSKGNKVKVGLGQQIDGLLMFPKLFDVSKPFTLRHDKDIVEFRFTADEVKAMMGAAAPK